ncbi:DUF6931 family protein [Jiella mangrovi]|uniref:Uncharacterized protein n=1 Tax=Jiella mangrovi TaxID=2821407 RepID=A0ABS4BGR9_9HYPH|nr:hypothetical protein [Jiella mangrovi]MBP0615942.1 hypothetical protein [Jiella mangrovi]
MSAPAEPIASQPAEIDRPVAREKMVLPVLAREVFSAIPEIGDDMCARPTAESCPDFLAGLLSSATPEEAITFCAYVLPPSASVAWGHRCLQARPSGQTAIDQTLESLIGDWVAQGGQDGSREILRREILEIAEPIRPRSPAVWIALALGWSSGSISAPDLPPLLAPSFATPRAVNAGVLGLLARCDLAERSDTLGEFVRLGRRIAAAIAAGREI